jgi:Sulfotransferase domain
MNENGAMMASSRNWRWRRLSYGGGAAPPVGVAGDAIRWAAQAYTRPTSGLRLLPDYLILGAQRAGTTSLHRYLIQHPAVRSLLWTKEVHFFDTNYSKGMAWYASHFPTRASGWLLRRRSGAHLVTGEASPYYLFHPLVPGRVAAHLPEVKLIALLRDPVQRAYSHYQHERSRGFETLGFDEAVAREPQRLAGEAERLLADPGYVSFNHQHYSYLARGLYADQLAAWRAHFPTDRLLVLGSERFFADPAAALARVLAFLDLPTFTPEGYERHNACDYYGGMEQELRRRLAAHFQEPNERLYAALGDDLGWES